MAGGTLGGDDDAITEINVTPFVDVMLVLLVIFMVTATYIVNQAIPVELPKAATGADAGPKNVAFVLDRDSGLFLDGNKVTWLELEDRVRSIVATGKIQALISADAGTPHGSVVRLIDTVRRLGIADFAINVEAAPSSTVQ